jgi:two-component system, OmpR family, response regulator
VSTLSEARILVTDSAVTFRGELAAHLGAGGHSVVVADAGAGLARIVEVFRPDIAIIEAVDDHTEALVAAARGAGPVLVIVTIPASAPPYRRVQAIRAGADDVVVKPFAIEELLARMERLVLRNGNNSRLTFGEVSLDEVAHIVRRGDAELVLTVTEFNLLRMFLRNAGRVLSKRQLLASVWGFDDYDVNLVEVHVCALRKKLEQHGPRIVQTVRGIGYVLRESTPAHAPPPHIQLGQIQLAFTA